MSRLPRFGRPRRKAAWLVISLALLFLGAVAAYAMPGPGRVLTAALSGPTTSADLGVDLSSTPSETPAVAGHSKVTYTATVTNTGPDDNTGYTVTLDIPSGTSFDSFGSAVGTCSPSGASVICTNASGIAKDAAGDVYTVILAIGPSFADTQPTGTPLHET